MREKYLLELGGENTDLGKYEALELFKFKKYSPILELDHGNIIIISTSRAIEKKIISKKKEIDVGAQGFLKKVIELTKNK